MRKPRVLTLSQNPCARNYKKEILAGFLDRTIAHTMVIGSHFGAFCDLVWSVCCTEGFRCLATKLSRDSSAALVSDQEPGARRSSVCWDGKDLGCMTIELSLPQPRGVINREPEFERARTAHARALALASGPGPWLGSAKRYRWTENERSEQASLRFRGCRGPDQSRQSFKRR